LNGRRWRRQLATTSALSFLHLFLMAWWISVAPLGLPWLVHVLFTVFHGGFSLVMTRDHREIVTQARLWAIVSAYLGEPELRALLGAQCEQQQKAA
jgi:hypothetical protein